MNRTDRAELALYHSQDCGGEEVMRARGKVNLRLATGRHPRMRDIAVLEVAAQMAGGPPPPSSPGLLARLLGRRS